MLSSCEFAVSFVSFVARPEVPALLHGVAGDKMLLQYHPHRMAQMAARHLSAA